MQIDLSGNLVRWTYPVSDIQRYTPVPNSAQNFGYKILRSREPWKELCLNFIFYMAEVLGTTDLHTIGVDSSILSFATKKEDESFEEKVQMKWS